MSHGQQPEAILSQRSTDSVDSVAQRGSPPPIDSAIRKSFSKCSDDENASGPTASESHRRSVPTLSTQLDSDDGSSANKASTPRVRSNNTKFGKEFAALYKGEDVREVIY